MTELATVAAWYVVSHRYSYLLSPYFIGLEMENPALPCMCGCYVSGERMCPKASSYDLLTLNFSHILVVSYKLKQPTIYNSYGIIKVRFNIHNG